MSIPGKFLLATPVLVLLSACASPQYQAFVACSTKTGYTDEKISATEYRISYYSARRIKYRSIEKFLRKRAAELCGGDFKLSEPQDIFNLIVYDGFTKDCSVYEFATTATCLSSANLGHAI